MLLCLIPPLLCLVRFPSSYCVLYPLALSGQYSQEVLCFLPSRLRLVSFSKLYCATYPPPHWLSLVRFLKMLLCVIPPLTLYCEIPNMLLCFLPPRLHLVGFSGGCCVSYPPLILSDEYSTFDIVYHTSLAPSGGILKMLLCLMPFWLCTMCIPRLLLCLIPPWLRLVSIPSY